MKIPEVEEGMYCPLCYSKRVYDIGKLKAAELGVLYKKMLGEFIKDEFAAHENIIFKHCGDCDLRFFHPSITGSEGFYEKLQKLDWYYMDDKDEYDFAGQFIAEGDSVLEIGCGKGAFAERVKTKRYTGLELNRKAVLMAEKKGIHVIHETIQDHAKDNSGKYDIVCFFQVMEHVPDVNGFVSSALECLKHDGLLIVAVPSSDSFLSSAVNNILNLPPHHVTWWSDRSLKSLSEVFGLEIVELNHEMLSDMHRDWYSATVTMNALNRILRRSSKLVDSSFTGRFIGKFAYLLGRFYSRGLLNENMRPFGHGVTVIYRKT